MLQCCSAAPATVRRDNKGKRTPLQPDGGLQCGSPSVGPSGVTLNDVSRVRLHNRRKTCDICWMFYYDLQ